MRQQFRVQRPPIHNISDLRDRCLNIWYNEPPAIYQGLVTSLPRQVEAVLRAKGRKRLRRGTRQTREKGLQFYRRGDTFFGRRGGK
ncbi:transposase domain containing protein [Trichonephila clavipes]|nr:transposase domain containing protein [Trichonephila clavipes]